MNIAHAALLACLVMGAQADGDFMLARALYAPARTRLGLVWDVPNLQVASALVMLADWHRMITADTVKASIYLSVAQRILDVVSAPLSLRMSVQIMAYQLSLQPLMPPSPVCPPGASQAERISSIVGFFSADMARGGLVSQAMPTIMPLMQLADELMPAPEAMASAPSMRLDVLPCAVATKALLLFLSAAVALEQRSGALSQLRPHMPPGLESNGFLHVLVLFPQAAQAVAASMPADSRAAMVSLAVESVNSYMRNPGALCLLTARMSMVAMIAILQATDDGTPARAQMLSTARSLLANPDLQQFYVGTRHPVGAVAGLSAALPGPFHSGMPGMTLSGTGSPNGRHQSPVLTSQSSSVASVEMSMPTQTASAGMGVPRPSALPGPPPTRPAAPAAPHPPQSSQLGNAEGDTAKTLLDLQFAASAVDAGDGRSASAHGRGGSRTTTSYAETGAGHGQLA